MPTPNKKEVVCICPGCGKLFTNKHHRQRHFSAKTGTGGECYEKYKTQLEKENNAGNGHSSSQPRRLSDRDRADIAMNRDDDSSTSGAPTSLDPRRPSDNTDIAIDSDDSTSEQDESRNELELLSVAMSKKGVTAQSATTDNSEEGGKESRSFLNSIDDEGFQDDLGDDNAGSSTDRVCIDIETQKTLQELHNSWP